MQPLYSNTAANSSDIATDESQIVEIPALDPVWKLRWQTLNYRSATWNDIEEVPDEQGQGEVDGAVLKLQIDQMKQIMAEFQVSKAPRLFDVIHEGDEITALEKKLAKGKSEDSESDEEEDSSDEESDDSDEEDEEDYETLKQGVLESLREKMAVKDHKRYFKFCRKVVEDSKDHHQAYKSSAALGKIVKQIKCGFF